jgi:hypothetical protein
LPHRASEYCVASPVPRRIALHHASACSVWVCFCTVCCYICM